MTVPTKRALLKQLDALPYPARRKRLGTLGAAEAKSPELLALVAALEQGDAEEAVHALDLAGAARLAEPIARALTHPSCKVRFRAAHYGGALLSREQLAAALPQLAPATRRQLLKRVACARRSEDAAALFELVSRAHGPREALPLLSALPPGDAARALPELGFAFTAWRTLSFRAPDLVLGYLRALLTEAPADQRFAILQNHAAIVGVLCLRRAEALLDLLAELGPEDALPSAVERYLPSLARRFPKKVAALLTRPAAAVALAHAGLPRPLRRAVGAFDAADVGALAMALVPSPPAFATLLSALPPSRREAVMVEAYQGALPRLLPEVLLALLPHRRRDAEAARMLGLREVQDDRATFLRVLAARHIDGARGDLQRAAVASKAEDRATASALLIDCTGRSRQGLGETLAFLARLKNDQDPVRLAAVLALGRAPPSVFLPSDVPALSALVDWVVEARDTSHATRMGLQALAFKLLHHAAATPGDRRFDWAFETLRKLAGQSGALQLPPLERNLPRGAEEHILERLLPLMRAARKRDSFGLALSLSRALGRRAWALAPLQELLEQATWPSADWSAAAAIEQWLADPKARDARVEVLLKRDESVATVGPVLWHLHTRRQDLLDPYLEGRRLKGEFWKGKAGWLPPLVDGFGRWLFRQQERFGEVLSRVAADASRPAWERMGVLSRLGRLETSTPKTLAPFVADDKVEIIEAALGALAWLDRPLEVLPTLFEHLGSDRARVAMYAVPRVAMRVPAAPLLEALDRLLSRGALKVTVRKEVLRLLGAHRSPRSLPLLTRELDAEKVHPDVQIAVGHGARALLDEPAAWPLLERLAQSSNPDVAQSLLDASPRTVARALRPRYAQLLLTVAAHPALPVRKRAFTTLCEWTAGAEEVVAASAAASLCRLESGGEWREAAAALAAALRDGKAWAHAHRAVEALLAAPLDAAHDAQPGRDQPARQRLFGFVELVLAWPPPALLRCASELRALGAALARDGSLFALSARLAVAAEDFSRPRSTEAALRKVAEAAARDSAWGQTVASAVAQRLAAAAWQAEELLALADALVEVAPLVALTLVTAAGQRTQWPEPAAARLRALRRHPAPFVQACARAVATAAE